jgi:hypothetical protein
MNKNKLSLKNNIIEAMLYDFNIKNYIIDTASLIYICFDFSQLGNCKEKILISLKNVLERQLNENVFLHDSIKSKQTRKIITVLHEIYNIIPEYEKYLIKQDNILITNQRAQLEKLLHKFKTLHND